MNRFPAAHPAASAAVSAIRTGDVVRLRQLLDEHPELASGVIVDATSADQGRTLLHIVTDWPGHYPRGAETVAVLVDAGADVNARFTGGVAETPLHWAASSNDVPVLDALLDHGADIHALGGAIANGSALTSAVAFAQWNAAHRLVERGATPRLADAAALGMLEQVQQVVDSDTSADEINLAFWYACHGGQQPTAEFLLGRGAELNWIPPWEKRTPLDAAARSGFDAVADWLRARGAVSAASAA